MNIKKITSLQQLMTYREVWNDILSMCQNNNPFIEFEWIRQWLCYFQDSFEPYIYLVEHEDEVIAIFPFIKKRTRFYNYIHFAGYGQANYMDIVAVEKWKEIAIRTVMNELINERRKVVILHGLLDSKGTANAFIHYCTDNDIPVHKSQIIAPFIDLQMENFDDFIKKKMKKHGGDRKEKRMKKLGNVAFHPLDKTQLETMFRLHEKRWKSKIDTSGFSKGHTHDFYKNIAFLNNKVIETKIDGLFIENRLVAFFYGFVCRNRYVLYILAHDDDFGVFSPGRMLLKETIKNRYRNQVQNFDLSIGFEPYKLDWNTNTDRVSKVILPCKGWLSRFGYWHVSMRDKLIQFLKKNKSLVHFKRNTLGKLLNFLHDLNPSYFKKTIKTIGGFLFQKNMVEIYRIDRRLFEKKTVSKKFQLITLKELIQHSSIFKGNVEEIIKRLYQKQQCYCLIQDGMITNYFWVNEKVLQIDVVDVAEQLPSHSAYIYDWQSFDGDVASTLFEKNNKLLSIYVAIPNHCKDKTSFHDQGFIRVYQITKKVIFGFRFISRRNF
ncbi:GNAT family N-acetyltransferase [Heyndrickxia vini]|uniref:GNAT family N-acetyltransferase n=1 Tax=Heyndrickxia vini TaxID=1476025 RepID=A0ABX7DWN4_9BACI|nr:GNAT family N-acetyltransferase [Heyndrickxia vini]QQZ07861.1 GNAT family N-acetyltransferase [Heyndrickxia vini]